MTAKEYLKQYEEADRKARRLKIEYEKEKEQIDLIRSPLGSDGTPHGTGVSDMVQIRAMRLIDKADKLKTAELAAIRVRQEVFRVVHMIPGDKGSILYERYINLKRWDDVADTVHLSLRQVHRIHQEALFDVQDVIEWHIH